MQNKTSNEVWSVCGREVNGDFTVTSKEVEVGGAFIISIISSPDRDFNDCDACNSRVHWRCSRHPDSGYCDFCFEKYGLEDPAEAGLVPHQ